MGKHNVKNRSMHQKKQIGIKDNRAGCLGVPVLGAGGSGQGSVVTSVGWSCFLPRKGRQKIKTRNQ